MTLPKKTGSFLKSRSNPNFVAKFQNAKQYRLYRILRRISELNSHGKIRLPGRRLQTLTALKSLPGMYHQLGGIKFTFSAQNAIKAIFGRNSEFRNKI